MQKLQAIDLTLRRRDATLVALGFVKFIEF